MRAGGRLGVAVLFLGACAAVSGGACATEPSESPRTPPPLTLEAASEQVTFASIEQLGPHRSLATLERVESHAGRETSRHTESVDIRWESWDRFQYRRDVDGRPVSESVVSDGQAWHRRQGGRWSLIADPETHRQQLRLTWNAWEQAVGPFGDRMALTRVGLEPVEGRRAIRYTLSLTPSVAEQASSSSSASSSASVVGEGGKSSRRRRPSASFEPTSLSGVVWVDEATAVRLTGQVTGTLARADYTRTLSLQLARTGIGLSQDITPPDLGEGRSP